MRVLLAAAVLLAIVAATPLAHAGRGLTPVQAAEVKLLLLRAQAGRPARVERPKPTKKETRAAKMRAALRIGAEIKAERARKQAARDKAKKQEKAKRDAARLLLIEELIRTRAGSR